MEYHSAIKRNEQVTHATTWRTLKIIMLKPGPPPQIKPYCLNLFIEDSRKCKPIM